MIDAYSRAIRRVGAAFDYQIEALKLEVGDIDATRQRVHIRDGKGGKDRFVPLPQATLLVLRRFWKVHRHPTLLFPNRLRKLEGARFTTSPLDCAGVQRAIREAVKKCGIKKDYRTLLAP